MGKENQKTDFLDITIQKRRKEDWKSPIYRKPTMTASYHAVHIV
jgi:hypothetical protein